MNIEYRSASATDFDAIVEIFLANMNLSIFTSSTDKEALRNLAVMFLANDFRNASYIQIAQCNDEICGVLIGVTRTISTKALVFDSKPLVKQAKANLRSSDQGVQVLSDLAKNKSPMSPEDDSVTSDCDSELVFFSTNAKYRRHKIGSTLVASFEAFLRQCHAKKYFVFSDSLCTYQYYDNNGYDRVSTRQNTFNPAVENYTYVKDVCDSDI